MGELEQKLKSGNDHIWQIGYESSECDEDNDTLEDWEEDEEGTADTSSGKAAQGPEEEKKDILTPEKLEELEGLRPHQRR